jgi:hypothetical protein
MGQSESDGVADWQPDRPGGVGRVVAGMVATSSPRRVTTGWVRIRLWSSVSCQGGLHPNQHSVGQSGRPVQGLSGSTTGGSGWSRAVVRASGARPIRDTPIPNIASPRLELTDRPSADRPTNVP